RFIFTNRGHFEEIADKTFKVFFIIIAPIIAGTLFLAPDIIRIVSGGGFQESVLVLRILIFALGFIFFGHFFNMLLIVGNAQRKLMQALMIAAAFNILLNAFLITRYSYIGAAAASVATEVLVVGLTAFLVRKHIRYAPSFKRIGRIFLSGAMMGAVLFIFAPYSFFIAGALGVMTYLGMLWLTKAISPGEVASLFQKESGMPLSEVERMETMVP
ncbi:MAG: polysaccharide biosynthesis C-terminal domain-containing protein, partial [Candidatus Moraniibacteriota bacterium]